MRSSDSKAPSVPESLILLGKLNEQAPKDNPRFNNMVAALRDAIEKDHRAIENQREELAKYEEAYEKLTAPSNRLGLFLQWLQPFESEITTPQLALISLGESEFVAKVDPKLVPTEFTAGIRVRVNDAYAVVGFLPPSEEGVFMKVADVLAGNRLSIGSDTPGSGAKIVRRGSAILEANIKSGDEVRLDPSGRIALEHLEKSENRDYFLESVPELPWEKIGGQTNAINLIRETIEQPLLHPELFAAYDKKPVKGILLYGPPGCGKTLIGKATAHNLAKEYSERLGKDVKEYFMAISGPKILNMWVGETERMVREIFKTARDRAQDGYLVFIFMDEAEAILRTRSSGRYFSMSNTVVPQFCAELDGLQSLENVVLILTSNRPDYIDPAVLRPGRIDRKVKVVRPDKDSALEILRIYLNDRLPLDPAVVAKNDGETDCARKELVEGLLEELWAKSKENEFLRVSLRNGQTEILYKRDLCSGAILESIIDRAKEKAIRRAIADQEPIGGITSVDLSEAMKEEFKENEIFPKTDQLEDWLQLLDLAPENVVSVRPIGRNRGEELARKSIV